MNPSGRKPDRHLIDGREMTVAEIADMLGVTKRSLVLRRHRMGGAAVSYQLVVDLYRQGRFQTRHDRWPRHLVNGEWITTQDAARRVGVQPQTLTRYMKAHGVTLAEAVDHYRKFQTGELARSPGRAPRAYYVNGKLLTFAQAAEKYHTTEAALRLYVCKHRCSLNTAVRHLEQRRKKQAEKDIMKILGF